MKACALPEYTFLHECLAYDKDAGTLTWKKRPTAHFKSERDSAAWNAKHAGKVAGTRKSHRGRFYISVQVSGTIFLAHRLIWKMVTGNDVPQIDHKDNEGLNNRWLNLREATNTQNRVNTGKQTNNTTGFKGVYAHRKTGRFFARAAHGGKLIHLGIFDTKEEAHAAYCEASKKLHGVFWRPE